MISKNTCFFGGCASKLFTNGNEQSEVCCPLLESRGTDDKLLWGEPGGGVTATSSVPYIASPSVRFCRSTPDSHRAPHLQASHDPIRQTIAHILLNSTVASKSALTHLIWGFSSSKRDNKLFKKQVQWLFNFNPS